MLRVYYQQRIQIGCMFYVLESTFILPKLLWMVEGILIFNRRARESFLFVEKPHEKKIKIKNQNRLSEELLKIVFTWNFSHANIAQPTTLMFPPFQNIITEKSK